MGRTLAEDAWAYGIIQVTKPSQRRDPAHFDGAASLLHAGLTGWGKRDVEIRPQPPDEGQRLPQVPASVCVGNLCAAWHLAARLSPEDAEPLYHEESDAEKGGVHIALMHRSNFFAASRARASTSRASPEEVYNVVNAVVAQHLAEEALQLPTFEDCLTA